MSAIYFRAIVDLLFYYHGGNTDGGATRDQNFLHTVAGKIGNETKFLTLRINNI